MGIRRQCAVKGCGASFRTQPTLSYFCFPQNEEIFGLWLNATNNPGLKTLGKKYVIDNFSICEQHFTNEQFRTSERKRLVANVIPTVALEEQKEEAPERQFLFPSVEEYDSIIATDSDSESLSSVIVSGIEDEAIANLNNEAEELKVICRLCMDENNHDQYNIFEFRENRIISSMITYCIPQIQVSKDDELSKTICSKCMTDLEKYYNFHYQCIESDTQQRQQLKNSKRKIKNEISSGTSSSNSKKPKVTNEKYDQIEAELMKALGEDLKDVDNIIIEVHNDEENSSHIKKLMEPFPDIETNLISRHLRYEIINTELDHFHNEFCLVDNYLFTFQLKKGNIRRLKCLSSSKCPAIAKLNLLKPETVELNVEHCHPRPTRIQVQKLTLLHIMRKKMQNDKSLNFRGVYEEICEKDPEIRELVPLKSVINQVCCNQFTFKIPAIRNFEQFYDTIENDCFQKLHFTHCNKQFYQEKFACGDGSKAIIFANCRTVEQFSSNKIMYVDASFKIDTKEDFKYQLVTILIWVEDSYFPILFALINKKSQEIYRTIFQYLHDTLAPNLRPTEIVTDYEANLYYALGEVYLDSHIGGSVFYYTQNLYKKICSLNFSKELETNSCFRNIYHMILMLPLLPVNTILDGLSNIEAQATELGLIDITQPIFSYVKDQWIEKVTPELFCVHRLENRINENVIAPFKKLRDFLMLSKGKMQKQHLNIVGVAEKLIELEGFLQQVYNAPSKKSFARDLSSSQKKNVIKAWQFIESHPKININNFFTKVLGYIKCMENQLWIWGFYRYNGDEYEELINAGNFSIVNSADIIETEDVYPVGDVVMDVIIEQDDDFLLKEETPITSEKTAVDFYQEYVPDDGDDKTQ